MENIFADEQPVVSAISEDVTLKPKRSAFIFITAESEASRMAFDDLKKIDGIQEVYLSLGAYDLVAKVSCESLDHIRENVLKRIRNIGSVKSTLTLTVI
ncbi:MAG: Lrp/AsnC ligand binding domain-containing protein [Nitrososphaerota archaeon]|nr:Lrp/AsnC ligand binding domain-containing protein [Nitrososphaerota archaeon]